MKYTVNLVLALCSFAMVMMFGCSNEPDYARVSFSASNISWQENDTIGNVSLRLSGKASLEPVVVDVEFEPIEEGGTLDQIEIEQTTGIEVRADSATRVFFKIKDNDNLNDSQFKFKVRIVAASDAAIGSISTCTVTIEDDEKAPRISTGTYDMNYSVSDFVPIREGAGSFELKLAKVGKYEYVAYNWFNMLRPRLLGVFDPETKTLTFDGTDYDGPIFGDENDGEEEESDFNAFGTAYYYFNVEMTEVMVFFGSGSDGKSPIVFNTDEIIMNETGEITGFADGVSCSYKIYGYDNSIGENGAIVGDVIGIYDMVSNPTLEYLDDDTESEGDDDTKSLIKSKSFNSSDRFKTYYSPSYSISEMPIAVKVF